MLPLHQGHSDHIHIDSISKNLHIEPTIITLTILLYIHWPNWDYTYLHRHLINHKATVYLKIKPIIVFSLVNLIVSYQNTWKPLTLQCCPIEDNDPLHQFVTSNLEKNGCPKHIVTYICQCRCLHLRIWHILHIDILRECTEALASPYSF